MKSIKYILSVWTFLAMTSLFVACTDDYENDGGSGDGKTLRLSITAPDQKTISPMSKSSQSLAMENIKDLCVLIYDNNGNILKGDDKSRYLTPSDLLSTDLAKTIYTATIPLIDNQKGYVAVIANAGNLIDDQRTQTYSSLQAYQFFVNEKNNSIPEFIMYYGAEYDLTKSSTVKAELVRIYSMITVVVDQSGLNGKVTVTPLSLQLKNIPNAGQLVPDSKIGLTGITSKTDAEKIEPASPGDNFLNGTNTHALYLYENMQGYGLNESDDQQLKTPPGITPTKDRTDYLDKEEFKKSSYIEIKALYKNEITGEAGIITYRFFLGKDATNNFDVQRNVHYKITMKLAGSGGENEISWRVDYDYLTNIQAQDVYMSYRASSTAKMYLDDVKDYVDGTNGRKMKIEATGPDGFNNWPVGINTYFDILGGAGNQVKYDNVKRKYYIEIRTNITNIHDYENKTGKVTFTLTSDNMPGVSLTREAKITQVPRLVDPIAYYKAGTNTDAKEIIVKEFDATGTPGRYVTLKSISKDDEDADGRWSVEIARTSDGPWFTIALDENGLSNGVSGLNGKISSTGEVKFWYKPIGPNNGSPRFAKLIVRYHDEDCMHDIFLRQGYDPIILGDPNRAWSSFNCLGTESLFAGDNEYGDVTDFPTQTGWLFNGGVDRAMHPFIPGHRSGTTINHSEGKNYYDQIEYSDKNMYFYQDVTSKINDDIYYNNGTNPWTHWQGDYITNEGNRTPSFKGPCPQGYVVADAFDYLKMIQKTDVYTGYVHDDDPTSGWTYGALSNGGTVEVENNNHCNPAKGALFVEREGCANLFFNFGKGVLRNNKATTRDPKLLEEIGIGHRYGEGVYKYNTTPDMYATFGQLTYENAGSLVYTTSSSSRSESYGAYYWNATPFTNWRNNMGKVDFGYNVFSTYPYLIDVPGRTVTGDGASGEARGISVYQNASFVRCVRSN